MERMRGRGATSSWHFFEEQAVRLIVHDQRRSFLTTSRWVSSFAWVSSVQAVIRLIRSASKAIMQVTPSSLEGTVPGSNLRLPSHVDPRAGRLLAESARKCSFELTCAEPWKSICSCSNAQNASGGSSYWPILPGTRGSRP